MIFSRLLAEMDLHKDQVAAGGGKVSH